MNATGPDSKPASRTALMRDVEYFSGELVRRLERLADLDARDQQWQQAAALTRRIRGIARNEIDTGRHREKQLARGC